MRIRRCFVVIDIHEASACIRLHPGGVEDVMTPGSEYSNLEVAALKRFGTMAAMKAYLLVSDSMASATKVENILHGRNDEAQVLKAFNTCVLHGSHLASHNSRSSMPQRPVSLRKIEVQKASCLEIKSPILSKCCRFCYDSVVDRL